MKNTTLMPLALALLTVGLLTSCPGGNKSREAAERKKQQVELETRKAEGRPPKSSKSRSRTNTDCGQSEITLAPNESGTLTIDFPTPDLPGPVTEYKINNPETEYLRASLTSVNSQTHFYPVWQVDVSDANAQSAGQCRLIASESLGSNTKYLSLSGSNPMMTGAWDKEDVEFAFKQCQQRAKEFELSGLSQSETEGQRLDFSLNVTLLKNIPENNSVTRTFQVELKGDTYMASYSLRIQLKNEQGATVISGGDTSTPCKRYSTANYIQKL